jgi:hypothetical protein
MIRAAIPLAALVLVSCGSNVKPEPEIRIQRVEVPVAVACVPESLPGPREYPDTDEALRAATDAAVRVGLIVAGRELRTQRLAEVEPVIAGCR